MQCQRQQQKIDALPTDILFLSDYELSTNNSTQYSAWIYQLAQYRARFVAKSTCSGFSILVNPS